MGSVQVLESYEIAELSDGAKVITCNPNGFAYEDESVATATLGEQGIRVEAESPFVIATPPEELLDYIRERKGIEVLEISKDGPQRLLTLSLSA